MKNLVSHFMGFSLYLVGHGMARNGLVGTRMSTRSLRSLLQRRSD